MAAIKKPDSSPVIVTGIVTFRSATDCAPIRAIVNDSSNVTMTKTEYECGYINVTSRGQDYLWLIPKAALSAIMMAQKQGTTEFSFRVTNTQDALGTTLVTLVAKDEVA